MHVFEIVNWISSVLLMGLVGTLLFWFDRRGFRGTPLEMALDT